MNILGISAFYHDSAACLVRDGEIVCAAQEERFSRLKHDPGFPEKAIDFCLEYSQLEPEEIDIAAFYDKPFIKFERILETHLAFAPLGLRLFLKSVPVWVKRKLWIKDILSNRLGKDVPVIFPEHHQSHAASAFFPSPFEEAAVVTIDGVGEWTTSSFGHGKGNNVDIIGEIHFPHSLGLLYSAFTYFCGFRVNSGEYKLMGLAPYGEPVYVKAIRENLIDIKEDGSFRLNMEYFNYCTGMTMTGKKFSKLFGGPPRKPESEITQREMDLARSIQEVTGDIMLKIARHAHSETGSRRLCMAGGVALNCVGNGRILREGPFEDIWIQPASGDAGGALGAALFAWYQYLDNERRADGSNDFQRGSLLGPEFGGEYIEGFLKKKGVPFEIIEEENIPDKVADLIDGQQVVGLFQGRMEFGPRALGNRSIIADARSFEMRTKLNMKIKFREGFRPFAPSVLEERCPEYFDIESPSPYMLLVAPVSEDVKDDGAARGSEMSGLAKLSVKRSAIPAVTHVDYSARIQTVKDGSNSRYYSIISKFDEKYGCPVIINTSFNVRGEPIVRSPEEAFACFMRTDMDCLVMGNCLVEKRNLDNVDNC